MIARIIASAMTRRKNNAMTKYHLRLIRPSRPGLPKHPLLLKGPKPRHKPPIFLPTASSLSSLRRRFSNFFAFEVGGDISDTVTGTGARRGGTLARLLSLCIGAAGGGYDMSPTAIGTGAGHGGGVLTKHLSLAMTAFVCEGGRSGAGAGPISSAFDEEDRISDSGIEPVFSVASCKPGDVGLGGCHCGCNGGIKMTGGIGSCIRAAVYWGKLSADRCWGL